MIQIDPMARLWPFQKEQVFELKKSISKNQRIVNQSPTGSGKTVVIAAICALSQLKKSRVWIVVPRIDLVSQASKHLKKWNVPHGKIDATHKESSLFRIHVVSKDTLIRRSDKIKNYPDLILWDECHIALGQQIAIAKNIPDAKWIGLTATPEPTKQSNIGLSRQSGGIYDSLILGKSIPWLMSGNYLSQCKYYAPPITGIEDLHKKGDDIDSDELENFLETNKIYGEVIQHYGDIGKRKPALVFCRSVKSAYKTAEKFNQAGFNFFCIEGKMKRSKRKALIQALKDGKIDGLTNCEIATYGLDIPRVEVGIILRYTFSRALYYQILGRTLRPYPGKKNAIILDHVNVYKEHIDPGYPEILPHNLENIKWNFHGRERKKRVVEKSLKISSCHVCFMPTTGIYKCEHCGAELKKRNDKKIELVDTNLEEIAQPKIKDLPSQEKREVQTEINIIKETFLHDYNLKKINSQAVADMIEISEKYDYSILWVYWQLTPNSATVCVQLLQEIARQKNYKNGWVFHKRKSIATEIQKKQKEKEKSILFGI